MDTLTSESDATTSIEREVPLEALQLDEQLALRDGPTVQVRASPCKSVQVRAIRADDIERLRALHASVSFESIVFRFFRAFPERPPNLAERFTHVDYRDRMALVAT